MNEEVSVGKITDAQVRLLAVTMGKRNIPLTDFYAEFDIDLISELPFTQMRAALRFIDEYK